MLKEALLKVVSGENLTEAEMTRAMDAVMSGNATQAQIGAFLMGLRVKGETAQEIAAAARVMREFARVVPLEPGFRDGHIMVDTCGTGGDGGQTFNVSTAAALIVAGGGLKVAKHGNRSVSSKSGSADVLEAFGVKVDLEPEGVARCLSEVGICFMFAPVFHPAMKYAAGPRKELGLRTIFNVLGPLTNPAAAPFQVMGVYDSTLIETLAHALKSLGVKAAMVVHGEGGLDEFSLAGPTRVAELLNGEVKLYEVAPEEAGLARAPLGEVKGGDAQENARILMAIFKGDESPRADMAVFNAAAAFKIAGSARDLKEGARMAKESILSGNALSKLMELTSASGGEFVFG